MVHDSSPFSGGDCSATSTRQIFQWKICCLLHTINSTMTHLPTPVGPTEADVNSTAVGFVRQESDTESVLSEGISAVPESVGTVGNPSETVESEFETPVPVFRPSARINEGFVSLDIVNVQDIFSRRACVTKAVPAFFKGAYRSAMRVALQEVVSGMELDNPLRITRGWKLFTILPRLLLTKHPRGGKGPQEASC